METQREVGFVTSRRDYLLHLEGLPSARINDVIVSEDGQRALVYRLEESRLQGLLLDRSETRPGDLFYLFPEGIRIPLGHFLLGRVVSPLGTPLDGRSALPLDGPRLEFDPPAAKVYERESIRETLKTGFTVIDSLLPLGKGQRELILGEPRSGKSSFLIDLIVNQAQENTVCIYLSLGKTEIDVKRMALELARNGADKYTLIIAATSVNAAPLIMMAPDTALTVAEFFARRGQDVLLIIDDLGTHAKYLREISLLAEEIPGRESYPGHIFHSHGRLMERAGRFKKELGGRSITLLPVIEEPIENITNLIPTNLMSQTDGHLLFSALLSSQGRYPAIDWERSVTRVGRQTLNHLQKEANTSVRRLLTHYKEIEIFTRFEAELSAETKITIRRAEMLIDLLHQEIGESLEAKTQLILLGLVFTPFLSQKELFFLVENKKKIKEMAATNAELRSVTEKEDRNFEEFVAALSSKTGIIEKGLG